MTADLYIKKLKQGYLVTALSGNYNTNKDEWAFATIIDLIEFLTKELSKKHGT